MALIGEQFDEADDICGVVASVRQKQDKLSLWTRTAANEAAQVFSSQNVNVVPPLFSQLYWWIWSFFFMNSHIFLKNRKKFWSLVLIFFVFLQCRWALEGSGRRSLTSRIRSLTAFMYAIILFLSVGKFYASFLTFFSGFVQDDSRKDRSARSRYTVWRTSSLAYFCTCFWSSIIRKSVMLVSCINLVVLCFLHHLGF